MAKINGSTISFVLIMSSILITIVLGAITLDRLQDQNRDLQKQSEIIKEQTDINQRFLRCLILVPAESFKDPVKRVEAVDRCAIESKLPESQNAESSTPTSQQTPTNQPEDIPTSNRPTQPKSTPPNRSQTPTSQPSQPTPSEEPGVVTQVLNSVSDAVDWIL